MTSRRRDLLLGGVFLVCALLWCWGVTVSVPTVGDEARLGPRGFPMAAGVLLGLLGLLQVATSFVGAEPPAKPGSRFQRHFIAALEAIGFLVLYALLLEFFGFLIATTAMIGLGVTIVVKERNHWVVLGMSIGLPLAIYLVLGKFLGVYFPVGRLLNFAF